MRFVRQASQSRVLNQACDLMSVMPPLRLPNLLLRSACMRTSMKVSCTRITFLINASVLTAWKMYHLKQFPDQISCGGGKVCWKGEVTINNLFVCVGDVLVIERWVPAAPQNNCIHQNCVSMQAEG